MSLQKAVASALSFAHLSAIGRGKAKAETDDDEKDKKDAKAEGGEGDDDEDKRDDKSAEGDDDDKSAEGEDDDAKAEDDKPDEKDDDKKDAKASDDDDDKDEEMRGKSAAAQARLREQARCAAIFASPAAARNPVAAANLAFKTRMTRGEALALLEAMPASAQGGNASRAARNPRVGADGGQKPTPQQATAARWDQHLQSAAKAGRR
jgi:hypothetical protein